MSKKASKPRDTFWHKTVNWEVLRSIGGSPLAAVSVLMPFIGYVILYNGQVVTFLEGVGLKLPQFSAAFEEAEIKGAWAFSLVDLEVLTRLNYLYVGSFFVGCGTILYRLAAPKTVTQCGSINSFYDRELDRASARRLRSMVATIKARRVEVSNRLISVAPWLDRDNATLKIAYGEMREQEDTQLQADVLSSFYNVESRYFRRKHAMTVFILYIIGFLLVSIPGIAFTAQVLLSICL
jgi:hypothetical protein